MNSPLFVLVCSALLLSGCGATAPTQVQPPVMDTRTVTADIAVPTSCISKIPSAPELLTDAQLLAGSGAVVFDRLWQNHIESADYIAQLEGALQACLKSSSPAPLPPK